MLTKICALLFYRQLTQLVQERHEAFARLKTAEDIMAAVRIENEMLRKSLTGHQVLTDSKHKTGRPLFAINTVFVLL